LKDLKGKSIRSYGGGQIKTYENLGMNPTFLSYSDIYEAIDRGSVDIANIAVTLSDAFKHYEVMKCVYMTNGGVAIATGLFMNRDVYKKLPKDIQDILMKLRAEYGIRYGRGVEEGESTVRAKWTTQHGVTFKELSPEDQKIFTEASNRATEYLLKKQEADGHTAARKVWNYYLSALKKYEDQEAKKK
jgi:TRAP-type C4-dicarboxylate transport system substrate-binding protein